MEVVLQQLLSYCAYFRACSVLLKLNHCTTSPRTLLIIFSYNFMFMFTAGGPLNFAGKFRGFCCIHTSGSKYWLEKEVTEDTKFEAVICLDTIGNGEEMFLHISKPAKDPLTQRLYDVRTIFCF